MHDVGSGTAHGAGAPMSGLSAAATQPWDTLIESLPIAAYVCDRDGCVTHFNRHAAEIWGREPKLGEPAPGAEAVRDMVASGAAMRNRELAIDRPDRSQAKLLASVEPLRDAVGAVVGAVVCLQAAPGGPTRDERFDGWVRDVVDRSPVAIYATDANGLLVSFNAAAARLWGRAPVIGQDLWCGSYRLHWPDGRAMPLDTCPMAMALKSGEAVHGLEAVYERPDGTRGAFLAYPTLLRGPDGGIAGAVNMLVDISDRKQAEERQKVLVDELNHRVKNTLASVQSLAAHSLRGAEAPQDMRARFEARLIALSNAHNQLADRRWQDADLRTLAEQVLAPYRADHRVCLQGETVMVSARTAVALSLVLHELATNAVKYGALSTSSGRLNVAWALTGGDTLVLDWREAGGPAPKVVRQGFGTRFIEGSVTGELGGRITHEFEPVGVHCHIETPL